MPTAIEQYREAKNTYLKLRTQAKKELLARFGELSAQLLQIQRELLEDFGEKVSIPAKGQKVARKPRAEPPGKHEVELPVPPSPKATALQKQIDRQKAKLGVARSAGKPTKTMEDRIYEMEDELRLLRQS